MAKRNNDMAAMVTTTNTNHDGMTKAVQSRPAVRVECPGEAAVIARPSYTIHIAAGPGADSVQVSIDHGDWLPCREALGLWWYDWSGFEKGPHELSARSRAGEGIPTDSAPRRFSAD